jgi:outer membrane protein assembly factor BamB
MEKRKILKSYILAFFLAAILLCTLTSLVNFTGNARGETPAGWQVGPEGGEVTESNGTLTFSGGDGTHIAPCLYKEFKPTSDFEVSFQLKAETLGEVIVNEAGEGFTFSFGDINMTSQEFHVVSLWERARAGGQFLLAWHDKQCDIYGWGCNWQPFVYNGIGYNNGYDYWHPNPPQGRSNAPVKPDVWYTLKLKVTKNSFTVTGEVYAENGTLLGSLTIDAMNDFTFDEIEYMYMSAGAGGPFYVRNMSVADLPPLETIQGWQVGPWGGNVSESSGTLTLSGDDRAAGPLLWREFHPMTGFEISLQVNAATLGEVHRDPAGAGEGFAIALRPNASLFGTAIGVNFELRARGGGQFLLTRHNNNCDLYGWACDWTPFLYNSLEYNNGYSYWYPNPPQDRSNAPVKPNVWYTMKLKIQEDPFTVTTEVLDENGTLRGSYSTSDMNNFAFKDIKVIGISSGFGGTFYVRNITGIGPDSGDDDWPMFGHDLQHSGYSTSTAPNTNKTLWSVNAPGFVSSYPAVVDGKVYLGSYLPTHKAPVNSEFFCLNAATGAQIWSFTSRGDRYSSPAVADGKVYVGSDTPSGKVYCLDASTGAFIWSNKIGAWVISSPAVVDGKVFAGSGDCNVYCLDSSTGAQIWSYATAGGIKSSPAIAGGKVYIGSEDCKVYCLDAATGAFIWSYATGGWVESSPAVANGKVYIGSDDNKTYCLDAATGALIWNYTTGGKVQSSPAVANDKIYICSNDPDYTTYCLDASTGAFVWSYTTSNVNFSPAVADGKVYACAGNNLYCINAATGALTWNYTNYFASGPCRPAVADGKVYAGWGRMVYCFGLPSICDFDGLFKLNNARMIYPSDQTPKPLGCSAASVSDWTASAFISTKLETATEGLDTNSAFVNQTTGKPMGTASIGIVSFGGPVVNPVVAYAESALTPVGDRAPLRFYADAGTCYFQHHNGTGIPGANLPESVINENMDMFVIELYRDGDGRYTLLCYGFGWKGTYAAGKYFDTEIYPNLASATYTWIVVKWEDTNGNEFVNTAADGDTYTVIATGQ